MSKLTESTNTSRPARAKAAPSDRPWIYMLVCIYIFVTYLCRPGSSRIYIILRQSDLLKRLQSGRVGLGSCMKLRTVAHTILGRQALTSKPVRRWHVRTACQIITSVSDIAL
jgi:hypothetical protein